MLGDIHGESGFAHARSGRDHNHLRRMESAGHAIEFHEAGGDAGDAALMLVKFFNRFDRFHDLVFHGRHLAFEAILADGMRDAHFRWKPR